MLGSKGALSLDQSPWSASAALSSLPKVGGWTRPEHVSLALTAHFAPPDAVATTMSRCPPFKSIRSATLFVNFYIHRWEVSTGADAVEFMLLAFPSLDRLRVVVSEPYRSRLDWLGKEGMGGKGPDFFTVVIGDPVKKIEFN